MLLLDHFRWGILLYVLMRLYLCLSPFLYLDLFILGDDSWISYGSSMQTKHLCLLIHIRLKGEVGTFFAICVCLCCTVLSVPCSLVDTLGSLVCGVFVFCYFPICCPGTGVVLDCLDS